jgi:hypothetical protein
VIAFGVFFGLLFHLNHDKFHVWVKINIVLQLAISLV